MVGYIVLLHNCSGGKDFNCSWLRRQVYQLGTHTQKQRHRDKSIQLCKEFPYVSRKCAQLGMKLIWRKWRCGLMVPCLLNIPVARVHKSKATANICDCSSVMVKASLRHCLWCASSSLTCAMVHGHYWP